MRRSEQRLEKLSWEHQDAIKFARNIAKGLGLDTDIQQVRSYAINIAENFLEPHFNLEERCLIARLNDMQIRHPAVDEVLKQHREFGQLKIALRRAADADLRSLLDQFRTLMEAHVQLEEMEFFPFILKTLSDEQLRQAELEIDSGAIVNCSNWPDPFWRPRL
ncbi:MAG: hemerythrin domain-containing protein [Chromatiaceae bacterium]|nr:hemerythrin domain-containing protein [Chromatiaceae bacterium]